MKHVYVYYRVDPAQKELAVAQVDALLARMASHCQQSPRRLTRCDDAWTWMELYEGITDFLAFSASLAEAARQLDCSAFTLGERHLECFIPPSPDVS